MLARWLLPAQTKTVVVYYGTSTVSMLTGAEVLALSTNVFNPILPLDITITAGANQFMYWASPVDFGPVQFLDLDSMFVGGWDGAHGLIGFPSNITTGPRVVTVNNILYNLYRTDFAGLGYVPWQIQELV